MDWNPQTLQYLSQSFVDTLSHRSEIRRRAKEDLSTAADAPNYGLAVLRLVAEPSVDEKIRQCAAVNFKNHLKTRWVHSSATPISDGEKEQIKTLIVPLMLSATWKIQAELSEALAVIGNHDSPEFWSDMLPDLKSRLQTAIDVNDFASVNGILAIFNALFERFRHQCKSDTIPSDLKYCSDSFAAPLWTTVQSISKKINGVGPVATLRQLLFARRLCCMIFYSLNYFGVAEEFKDKQDEWMNEFKNNVTERYPDIKDRDCLSLADDVRVAVCEIVSNYMEKEEKVLEKHMSYFVEAVSSLVVSESVSPRLDAAGMEFLRKCVDHGDYDEIIKRDMEGNGLNMRRRIDCEPLKGQDKDKIRAQIDKWLALFAENPAANWEYKECAIYMVVSLATGGGASVSSDLVDVESFFTKYIITELQGKDMNAFPMLKAAALNFLTVFRFLIPKHVAMHILGDLVRCVDSDWRVVHSSAAICIEKLLLVKDNNNPRYTSTDIEPIYKDLVRNLADALLKEGPLRERNEYVMRCMMRVFEMADKSSPWTVAFDMFLAINEVACWKPENTRLYNHYLFEALATLVRRKCEDNPHGDAELVSCLYTNMNMILGGQIKELYPYMFQLFAQLVELNRPPSILPAAYIRITNDMLLGGEVILWEDESPATLRVLARWLQSYLQQAPDEVNKEGRLRHVVVDIINKLVSSPTTEEAGFRLLNTVIESYEYGVISEYMNQIWASLFTRLQSSKTPTLVMRVIVFMSLVLVKHGAQTLVDLINSVEVDLFHVILGEFWIPNLKTITGCTEVKLSAVASTKLLCESVLRLDPEAEELWGKLLDAIVTLLSQNVEKKRKREIVEDDDEEPDLSGYHLRNAVVEKEDWDPLKEIKDPKQFLVDFPAKISEEFSGKFPLTFMRQLSPTNQAALVKLCNSYNIDIV